MLHLAQVKQNPTSGEMALQLLARQQSEYLWDVIDSEVILCNLSLSFGDGALVLVELGDNQQVVKVETAQNWVIRLVETYLTNEVMNSEWVEKEQEKVEQWRQEITAKSLDLTRRQLELETQKEHIQELEVNLKEEKEALEIRWQKLKELETNMINDEETDN
ncbi:hypothetical protein VB715_19875 [Crocosphaera sp. UHCC 0190]|uniref:hypothetical protein n=1 Tax=Crocosphaera sp. UHCC 0190 TaxID=3110246 RepID=UPI002B1F591C|nr:hypothetical protein [Crocosphaera sp. UHCC 0190]MEA5512035.1 hypothetical protein [Crocosphaera sp. UHCC 0190]